MVRSQPLNLDKLKEPAENIQNIDDRTVIKTEIVDSMFDLDKGKSTIFDRIGCFLYRVEEIYCDVKWLIKNLFIWTKVIRNYRPWDIHCFLPMFVKHLELYIDSEKRYGVATEEYKKYKISTAQESLNIIKKLLDDDYVSGYTNTLKEKWGSFKYKKTTYANGSVGYLHMAPDEYSRELHDAHEKAAEDEKRDLKRLGRLIEKSMLDWWD